ncbi:MAG: UDP-glucose 4-epimerase [Gammaproteobacteria bacterium]|jgi:UDP-glucose 4-epimerase|nr:UDP-glucose 4-epimerase [Gammaproteobacteria bacterium]
MLKKRKVLVTGGAGYIGSHMVLLLIEEGYEVWVIDNLSKGYRDAVFTDNFIQADIADRAVLNDLFSKVKFDAVIHFAGFIEVGESVKNPQKYYANNYVATLILLEHIIKANINNFIFSSTAAVYGEPQYLPLDTAHPVLPINPYGQSKLFVEKVLMDYDRAYGLKSIALRYFNVAGADPKSRLGERHSPETHLIPLLLRAAHESMPFKMFGADYPTKDGTCIRDYIHVVDICRAHLLALDYLLKNKKSEVFNLGNGQGFSIREIINMVTQATQKTIQIEEYPRRPGDPAILVADSDHAKTNLGFVPVYPSAYDMVDHAWRWYLKRGFN